MGSSCGKDPEKLKTDPSSRPQADDTFSDTNQALATSLVFPQAPIANGAPKFPTAPVTMGDNRKSVMRTVSVLHQQEDENLRKQFPEVAQLFPKFDNIKRNIHMDMDKIPEEGSDEEEEDKGVLETDDRKPEIKFILQMFDDFKTHGQQKMMGDYMASIQLGSLLVDYYCRVAQGVMAIPFTRSMFRQYVEEDDNEEEDEHDMHLLVNIRKTLWNYSHNSKRFAEQIAENETLFNVLGNDLYAMHGAVNDITPADFIFTSAVNIIHNCARANVSSQVFQIDMSAPDGQKTSLPLMDILTPFLKTKNIFAKLITLLALSHIVNEEQNKILTTDDKLFDFLLDKVRKAFTSKEGHHEGFLVEELLDGLTHLAKNDKNKDIIMDKNAFPLLKEIVYKGKNFEKAAAVKVVWELSFTNKNKKVFLGDQKFWKTLNELKSSEHEDLASSAKAACFTIVKGHLEDYAPDGSKTVQKPKVKETKEEKKAQDVGHVMISYNWADQKMMLKVRDYLLNLGFQVWMDVDKMEGDVLEAMARAVEEANVVLICFSEKYKDSKNCRMEAEYANQRNKEIVPVLTQRGYKPDGWLGILVGSKLFYEFSDKYPFEQKIQELGRELSNRLRSKVKAIAAVRAGFEKASAAAKATAEAPQVLLMSWTTEDLSQWLEENKLQAFKGLKSLSAEQLIFLYKLFRRAPEFFYRCLEEKLGLKSLEELMRFSNALEKLSQDQPEINQLLY